jgi:hypothetical protein
MHAQKVTLSQQLHKIFPAKVSCLGHFGLARGHSLTETIKLLMQTDFYEKRNQNNQGVSGRRLKGPKAYAPVQSRCSG